MPCTSFSKALIVLGVSWSMSKLESLSSLLELLVSLSESLSLSLRYRKEGRKVGEGSGCPRLRVLSPSPPGGIGGVEGVKLSLAHYHIESCIYVSRYQY